MSNEEPAAAEGSNLNFNIIQVRAPGKVPALRKWFPMAMQGKPPASFFIAMEPATQTLLGGASLRMLREKEQKLTGRFQIFVRPDMRRHGIGSKLLEILRRRTARTQGESLLAGQALSEKDPSIAFFVNAGMEPKRTMGVFEIDDLINNNRIGRIYDHYLERRGVPTDMETVPLAKARPAYVKRFVLKHLGGLVGAGVNPNDPSSIAPQLSFVVRSRQGILGLILGRLVEPGVAGASAVAVLPEHRGSWVNLALRHNFQQACIQNGLEKIRYEADLDRHPDSVRFAKRIGFEMIDRKHFYGCDVGQPKVTNNEPRA